MGRIVHSVDWFQYSVRWPEKVSAWPLEREGQMNIVRTAIPHLSVSGMPPMRPASDEVMGMKGYALTYDLLYASAHVDPKRREMKIGVRMTGQDLQAWRDLGGNDERLIGFVAGCKGSISRIDIAFDLFDYGIDVPRIYEDWKKGRIQCNARRARPLTDGVKEKDGSITEATTVYFGARTSDLMIRIYEKGKETGTGLDWVRVELEIKGDKAKAILADCERLGFPVVGRQLLRDYFQKMPYKFWKELTLGDSVALTSVGRKMTEREAWIRNVVFPVLVEEIAKEWDGCIETGITRGVEELIREHWTIRATAIRKQYGLQ